MNIANDTSFNKRAQNGLGATVQIQGCLPVVFWTLPELCSCHVCLGGRSVQRQLLCSSQKVPCVFVIPTHVGAHLLYCTCHMRCMALYGVQLYLGCVKGHLQADDTLSAPTRGWTGVYSKHCCVSHSSGAECTCTSTHHRPLQPCHLHQIPSQRFR